MWLWLILIGLWAGGAWAQDSGGPLVPVEPCPPCEPCPTCELYPSAEGCGEGSPPCLSALPPAEGPWGGESSPPLPFEMNLENSTFDTGAFAPWGSDVQRQGGTTSKQMVTSPVHSGGYAAEMRLQVTSPTFGILRNELTREGVASIGDEYIYEFREYIPTDFAKSSLYIEVWQFLPTDQHVGPFAGWGPPIQMGIQKGRWLIQHAWDNNGLRQEIVTDIGRVQRERWVSFRVEVRWSLGDDGYLRIYVDGQEMLCRNGPTTFSAAEVPYFKWGLYTRRGWTHAGRLAPLHRFRIFLDSFRAWQIDR